MSSALTRLQDDLWRGLTCVRENWHYRTKGWVTGVCAIDIDEDGDNEVLVCSHDGRVSVLSREGRLLWDRIVGEKTWLTTILTCPLPTSPAASCIITTTRNGKIYLLDQQGEEMVSETDPSAPRYWYMVPQAQAITQMCRDASVPFAVVFVAEDRCVYSFDFSEKRVRWRFSTGERIRAIFTCDIDGDGRQETLVGSDSKQLSILSSEGELLATKQMDQAIYSLYAADLDLDGKIEILVGTRTKKLFALTSDLRELWSFTLSSRPLAMVAADVYADRRLEVLVSCDDQSLIILEHTGKLIWRQALGKRFHSLAACDLDLDGHTEILAGADDSQMYALRIQLTRDLEKKIRRSYALLGKPDISGLQELTGDQLDLLLGILGINYSAVDKKLNLTYAKALLAAGHFEEALLALLKLEQQKFQLLWEKEQIGYRRALCLVNLARGKRCEIVVSSPNDGILIFNVRGHQLWSEQLPDGSQIVDVQAGYISAEQSEDLFLVSSSGILAIKYPEKTRPLTFLPLPEPAVSFYLLAPSYQRPSELLVGGGSGNVYLYRDTFEEPVRTFHLPAPIQRVYASAPDQDGNYRTPELLISTTENQLLAYTRGGNHLWTYTTRGRILTLCTKDLDNDGHLKVLIGSEERNIYVLDEHGKQRWRYVLYHNVQTLDAADLDGDGKMEILAGCADGILYVFTSNGDLIWRYEARDRIQALRVADIDLDGNFEIIIVGESHLETLQVVNSQAIRALLATCWEHLLSPPEHADPLAALLPLIASSDPYLRAAALVKLTMLEPLPPQTFDLLEKYLNDSFTHVRKALSEALMRAYPADPARARTLLSRLFSDRMRDVRLEVIENLALLAEHDWAATLFYLERSLRSSDRNTSRAAMRRISHLLGKFAVQFKYSQHTLGEALFKLVLTAAEATSTASSWVRREAGRVLADFLNLYADDVLLYLYRLFAQHLEVRTLNHVIYNLADPAIQRAAVNLCNLSYRFSEETAQSALAGTARSLEEVRDYTDGTDLWLIFRELAALAELTSIEQLAAYEFSLKAEQFLATYARVPSFLRIGEHLQAFIRPLKTYLRRTNPNERLNFLLESIAALEPLRNQVDREYGVSFIPHTPLPLQPEFVVLKALIARWQEMLRIERNELRGYARLQYDLQPRTVHLEETIAVWFHISNQGRAPAREVKVALLADESFTSTRLSFSTDVIPPGQDIVAECLISPLEAPVTLTFEVMYDNSEHGVCVDSYQEHLDLIEWRRPFTPIANPYTTGAPIHDPDMFYGREADMAYLRDNLTRTTAQTVLVLYGQRRSGKTTLLNQFADINHFSQYIPVMIDMQKIAYNLDLYKFLFKISYAIYQALHKKNLPAEEPLSQTFRADPLFAFERFLDKLDIFQGQCKLILLLDEFEVLEQQVRKGNLQPEIFDYLRSIMQERHYMHFLLSGTHHIEKLTRDYWSVFFNIALHYRLSSKISPEGAEKLITEPVLGMLEYEPQAVRKIRQLTADQPYLIHLVCRSLVDHCNRVQKNYVTLNDVNLVLESVLITGTVHFDWLWNRFGAAEQLLLRIIAEGSRDEGRYLDLDDIRTLYQQHGFAYRPGEVIGALKGLWAEDVIEADTSDQPELNFQRAHYAVAVGLFRQWLRQEQSLSALTEESSTLAGLGQVDLSLQQQHRAASQTPRVVTSPLSFEQ